MLKIQKMDFLIALYILSIAISELMGGKTWHLLNIGSFPLNASVAIFVIPIIFSINDIVTEVFGKARAQSLVRSAILMVFFIMLFSILATHLPPSTRFQPQEKSYDAIFEVSTRIAAASLTAFAIAEILDVFIFVKLREKMGKQGLWLRTNVSNFISEFFDSFIFIFLAFYAFNRPFSDNLSFLFGLIIPYWLLKCFMSVLETPLVYLGVKWLKTDYK